MRQQRRSESEAKERLLKTGQPQTLQLLREYLEMRYEKNKESLVSTSDEAIRGRCQEDRDMLKALAGREKT